MGRDDGISNDVNGRRGSSHLVAERILWTARDAFVSEKDRKLSSLEPNSIIAKSASP